MAAPEEGSAAFSFVGRDRELARAVGLLDEARAGRGCRLLCTGEAGIGKTRLAEETAAMAAARGTAVVWARSSDRDIAPPYGLWRLALQDLPGRRRDKPGPDLWSLAFGETAGRAPGSGSELDRGQRFALFSEVRERLARAAEPNGLLLVLDDIQWADEPSLLLLAHLVRQLRGVRMLILATCREPAPAGDRSGELIRQLSADANTERAVLAGLPPVAVAALHRGRYGLGPHPAGRPGRAGADQPADRRRPVRFRAHRAEPRPAHLGQTRLRQPQSDRRLVEHVARGMSTGGM